MRVARVFLVVLALATIGLSVWAFWIEPDRILVRRVTLNLPDWPVHYRPLTLALIGDLHAGSPHIDRDKLAEIVALTNAEAPDAVLLLGDYVIHGVVGGRFMAPDAVADILARLSAPLGTFAVLGNHDWWLGAHLVRSSLERAGIDVVDNEARLIAWHGGAFWIVGFGDHWEGRPWVSDTLAKVNDGAPVLAMTHNPDLFPDIPRRVSVTFASHTHGGQVNLPLFGRPVVPSAFGERFAYGHIVEGGRHLYVTSGVGTSILPVRFRVPPEIVILTLVGGA